LGAASPSPSATCPPLRFGASRRRHQVREFRRHQVREFIDL